MIGGETSSVTPCLDLSVSSTTSIANNSTDTDKLYPPAFESLDISLSHNPFELPPTNAATSSSQSILSLDKTNQLTGIISDQPSGTSLFVSDPGAQPTPCLNQSITQPISSIGYKLSDVQLRSVTSEQIKSPLDAKDSLNSLQPSSTVDVTGSSSNLIYPDFPTILSPLNQLMNIPGSHPIILDESIGNNRNTPPLDARVKDLEEKLKITEEQLSKVTSTMEAQQKLVHDTIGHYMSMKSEFEAKESNLEERLRDTQATVQAKEVAIKSLEEKLEETVKQLDRVNAFVTNRVIGTSIQPSILSSLLQPTASSMFSINTISAENKDGQEVLADSASQSVQQQHDVKSPTKCSEGSRNDMQMIITNGSTINSDNGQPSEHVSLSAFSNPRALTNIIISPSLPISPPTLASNGTNSIIQASAVFGINNNNSPLFPGPEVNVITHVNEGRNIAQNQESGNFMASYAQSMNMDINSTLSSNEPSFPSQDRSTKSSLSNVSQIFGGDITGSGIDLVSGHHILAKMNNVSNTDTSSIFQFAGTSATSQPPKETSPSKSFPGFTEIGLQDNLISPTEQGIYDASSFRAENSSNLSAPGDSNVESIAIPSRFEGNAAMKDAPPLKRHKSIRSKTKDKKPVIASSEVTVMDLQTDAGDVVQVANLDGGIKIEASLPNMSSSRISTRWSSEEKRTLRHAIKEYGDDPDAWTRIVSRFPNRTIDDCKSQWFDVLKTRKGKWSQQEDHSLLTAYRQIYDDEIQTGSQPALTSMSFWSKVAQTIPGRNGMQCMARYTETLDPSLKRGKWSVEEDALLTAGVEKHGKAWVKVAECVPGRTQRQCRTRWLLLFPKESKIKQAEDGPASATSYPESQDETESVTAAVDRKVANLSLRESSIDEESDYDYDYDEDDMW